MDKPVPVPESLLEHPCEPVGAGGTVKSLSRGYTKNTLCIGEYKATIDGIHLYNERIKTTPGDVNVN